MTVTTGPVPGSFDLINVEGEWTVSGQFLTVKIFLQSEVIT